jgi:signal transduction histidine kinase
VKPRRRVGLMIFGAAACGAVTLVVAGFLAASTGVGPAYEVIPLTVLLALSWAYPVLVLRTEETEAFQLDEAFFVAMALLLPPAGTLIVFGAAMTMGNALRRRPLVRAAFNIGQTVTAAGLGLAVMRLITEVRVGEPTPLALGAAVVGSAVFLLVNGAAVSGVISLNEGKPAREVFLDGLDLRILVWAGGTALGLLAALGGAAYPWALVLGALPMAALNLVLQEHARVHKQTERAQGLLVAANQVHSSVALADVEEAIAGATRSLLNCREARIGFDPPGPGEVGVPVPEPGGERWLVVADPVGFERLRERERELLSVMAGIAAGAIQKARLLEREQEMRERLEELDTIKTEFVSSVSHELRTPLTSILGYLEMLTEGVGGELTADQERVLRVIDRNSQRLLILIEELLIMSRLESGSFRLSMAPVSVGALIHGAYQAVLPDLMARALEVDIEVATDVGVVQGDHAQLDRVLINLLTNAIKFTPDGGRIAVSARREDDWVLVEVADTGIGIPVEDQDKIFDRFFRSSSIAELAVPGTGLGLWITKTIIEEHGGEIGVTSEPGEGTQITVRLPATAGRPTTATAIPERRGGALPGDLLRTTAVVAGRPWRPER